MADPRSAELFFRDSIRNSVHPPGDPWGSKSFHSSKCKWRYRSIAAERERGSLNTPRRRGTARAADQRAAGIFQGFLEILRNRPHILEIRNPPIIKWRFRSISGDLAGIRLNLAQSPQNMPDGGAEGRTIGRALRVRREGAAALVVVALLRRRVVAAPWARWFR